MIDTESSLLVRYHPFSYGVLSLVFALPLLYGLLASWPDVTTIPTLFPGHWSTVALFSTLLSAGMALRSMTPATDPGVPRDRREE